LPSTTPNQVVPRGIYAPTITAFHPDGRVNLQGSREFVRFLLDAEVHGLVPLGSSGEPLSLTMDERKAVIEAIVTEVAGKVPVYAGVVDYLTGNAIEFSKHAKALGCAGLMLMAPYVMRPPKRDCFDHLRRVREAVGLPIMLYVVPVLSGMDFSAAEVQMLAEEDVIHSVKWSHAEFNRVPETRLLCGPSFPVFAGNDAIAFSALAAGADGWIGCLPMMSPKLSVQLYKFLAEDKDLDAARVLWYRLMPLVRMESSTLYTGDNDPHWLSMSRDAALLHGIAVGETRPPLSGLAPADLEKLRQLLVELGEIPDHGDVRAPARVTKMVNA
jgi:4-hydroxy-tetrahydrodipicolinate synthase